MHRSWVTYALHLCLARFSVAALTNRTIDDQFGDSVTGLVPTYSPASAWSQGANCTGCGVQLDALNTYDGSWHDSTHTPGDAEPRVVDITFNGEHSIGCTNKSLC